MGEEEEEWTAGSNPYLTFYREFCAHAPKEMEKMFDPKLSDAKRKTLYNLVDVSIAMKYSWAIPDERALQILKHFGPIVEMGAGTGYWGKLLQLRGVDVICYDLHVADDDDEQQDEHQDPQEEEEEEEEEEVVEEEEEQQFDEEEEEDEANRKQKALSKSQKTSTKESTRNADDAEEEEEEVEAEDDDDEEEVEVEQYFWIDVKKGTPKVLKNHSDRTLFLCYPDDYEDSDESMALQCLNYYSGDTIVHVGELFGQTLCLPEPWGRTSSPDFQVRLAATFHKVLQVPLPSWHSSVDSLTVWKRTKTCIIDNSMYAYIPSNERLDLVAACAATRHLLQVGSKQTPLNSKATAKDVHGHQKNKTKEGKRKRRRHH